MCPIKLILSLYYYPLYIDQQHVQQSQHIPNLILNLVAEICRQHQNQTEQTVI